MKRFIILIFITSLLFAVKPVSHKEKKGNDSKPKIEIVKSDKDRDHFQDTDSNSVNDQRENDFQLIKSLNSKFRNLFTPLKSEDSVHKSKDTKKQNRPFNK